MTEGSRSIRRTAGRLLTRVSGAYTTKAKVILVHWPEKAPNGTTLAEGQRIDTLGWLFDGDALSLTPVRSRPSSDHLLGRSQALAQSGLKAASGLEPDEGGCRPRTESATRSRFVDRCGDFGCRPAGRGFVACRGCKVGYGGIKWGIVGGRQSGKGAER